jgi:hypothetical protein
MNKKKKIQKKNLHSFFINKKLLKNKKAQVEIVGLLIIVIMISIILLFALKAMLDKKDSSQNEFIQRSLASSFIGSMLNTNSICTKDTHMDKVLIDCAKYPTMGGSNEFKCDNGMKSCEFASIIIEDMLNKTLKEWKKSYEFKVKAPEGQLIEELNFTNTVGNEINKDSVTTFVQPLSVDTSGYRTMEIILCIGGKCFI